MTALYKRRDEKKSDFYVWKGLLRAFDKLVQKFNFKPV